MTFSNLHSKSARSRSSLSSQLDRWKISIPIRCNEKRTVRCLIVILLCYAICSISYLCTSFPREQERGLDIHEIPGLNTIHGAKNKFHDRPSGDTATNAQQQIEAPASTRTNIWIAGMILDMSKMNLLIQRTLVSLNCNFSFDEQSHNIMDGAIIDEIKGKVGEGQNILEPIGVHILVPNNEVAQRAIQALQETKLQMQEKEEQIRGRKVNAQCAPIVVQSQSKNTGQDNEYDLSKVNNRIDRISILRDMQRSQLKQYFHHQMSNNGHDHEHEYDDDAVVILADLDLYKLPDVKYIQRQILQLQDASYPHDAVCAAGITVHGGGGLINTRTGMNTRSQNNEKSKELEFWYYDTFSTVFLPDTFSHPLKRRLLPYYYAGEDPRLVRSDDRFGNFTQGDIFRYFTNANVKDEQGNDRRVPVSTVTRTAKNPTRVKSCFGGMALYRARSYFESKCRYRLKADIKEEVNRLHEQMKRDRPKDHNNDNNDPVPNPNPDSSLYIMRYANEKEGRPCEHVVFNDCLLGVSMGAFNIAVNPLLKSFWARDF